jgi:hypothetical protein
LSRAIEQWVSHSKEKTLVESLNLDSSLPKLASRVTFTQMSVMTNSISSIVATAALSSNKLVRTTPKSKKQEQKKGILSYLRHFRSRQSVSAATTKSKEQKQSTKEFKNKSDSIMESLFGVSWDFSESEQPSPVPSPTTTTTTTTTTTHRSETSKAFTDSNKDKQSITSSQLTSPEKYTSHKQSAVETHNSSGDDQDDSDNEDKVPKLLDASKLITQDNLKMVYFIKCHLLLKDICLFVFSDFERSLWIMMLLLSIFVLGLKSCGITFHIVIVT